jgi:dolichyl-phosphate-mannose--protein O-mannosyl transferase
MELKRNNRILFITAVMAGLTSGICWFWVGERLDNTMGNFVAWHIIPVIIAFLLFICLYGFVLKNQSQMKFGFILKRGLFFVCLYYLCHWIPMVATILYCSPKGGF